MASISGAYTGYPSILNINANCYQFSSNIAANTSVMRIDLYVYSAYNDSSTYTAQFNTSINGNGTNGSWTWGYTNLSAGNHLVGTQDVTVTHAANGSLSCGFAISSSTSGWGTASASGTISSPGEITDFNFAPGAPASCTAVVTGNSITVTSGISTAYPIGGTVSYYVSYASSSDGGSTFGSWSSNSLMSSRAYTYSSLTLGLTYKFRVFATNTAGDGNSGYTGSGNYFLASGGKRWNGSSWVRTVTASKRWNGSAWVDMTIFKRWNGTAWVDLV